jgi:hypothetical protein
MAYLFKLSSRLIVERHLPTIVSDAYGIGFENNSSAYEKNFRLRDKNHAPFKLNGQSRTAFGLLKAPELQRLSVTVEILRVGVIR